MPRVTSVFLPTWPTDRWCRKQGTNAPPPETPLALAGRDGRRRVVTAVNHAAYRQGLRIGMTVTKAQVMLSDLLLHPAEPDADMVALEKLALWALQTYSPLAASDAPSGLVINTSGCDHLFGDEAMMLADMIDRLAGFGITARAAVADSWGAAHAVARFNQGSVQVIPMGEHGRAIEHLPIAALRLPPSMVAGLSVLGFDYIGELAAQPRAPLALRFGPEVGRRLDQAYGRIHEPIEPARDDELIEVRREFAEPIGAPETLTKYITILAQHLCEALEAKSLGVRHLDLLFVRVDNRVEAIRVSMARPVRDPKRLARLLTDKLETVDPGFGVDLMRMIATHAEPLLPKQSVSILGEEPESDVTELIDTLANRIGAGRLYRFAPVESDVPERSIQRIAATAPDVDVCWPTLWPRPTRLLPKPEHITTVALLPDNPPVSFIWRGVRRRVRAAYGPERIFGEWWKREEEREAVRDYYKVEDDGGERFWIYRAGDGEDQATGSHRWFLHGIFG